MVEFNLADAVSLRCKISPRILSGCDELKVIVNLRSRLFFSERKGNKDIEKTRAHERPGRGGFLSNSRVPLAWCSLKTNKKTKKTKRYPKMIILTTDKKADQYILYYKLFWVR